MQVLSRVREIEAKKMNKKQENDDSKNIKIKGGKGGSI